MGNSTFSRDFKKMLTNEVSDIFDVTLSYKTYWKTIVDNLISIYGDFANPKKNLALYQQSAEYNFACRVVKKIRSIPIITFDDIKAMLEEDEIYERDAAKILNLKDQLKNSLPRTNREIVLNMASILGLLPNNKKGLFSHLVNTKDMSEKQKHEFVQIIDNLLYSRLKQFVSFVICTGSKLTPFIYSR